MTCSNSNRLGRFHLKSSHDSYLNPICPIQANHPSRKGSRPSSINQTLHSSKLLTFSQWKQINKSNHPSNSIKSNHSTNLINNQSKHQNTQSDLNSLDSNNPIPSNSLSSFDSSSHWKSLNTLFSDNSLSTHLKKFLSDHSHLQSKLISNQHILSFQNLSNLNHIFLSSSSNHHSQVIYQPDPNTSTRNSNDPLIHLSSRTNYASFDCSASIHRVSKHTKSPSAILNEKKDKYMLTPCLKTSSRNPNHESSTNFVIFELCDEIEIDHIVLANFEFFSSMFKLFKVSVSNSGLEGPGNAHWVNVGLFKTRNIRGLQVFPIKHLKGFYRYVRLDFLSFYGSEYYCPLSLVRIYGLTQIDAYRRDELIERQKSQQHQHQQHHHQVQNQDQDATQRNSSSDSINPNSDLQSTTQLESNLTEHPKQNSVNISTHNTSLLVTPSSQNLTQPDLLPIRDIKETNLKNLNESDNAKATSDQASADLPTDDSSSLEKHATTHSTLSSPETPLTPPQPQSVSSDQASFIEIIDQDQLDVQTLEADPSDPPVSQLEPGIISSPNMDSSNSDSLPPAASKLADKATPMGSPTSQGSESIFGQIMKRLSNLEGNHELALKYVEEQAQLLELSLQRLDQRLGQFDNQLVSHKERYEQSLQELKNLKSNLRVERSFLKHQIDALDSSISFIKRFGFVQFISILTILVFLAFTRLSHTSSSSNQFSSNSSNQTHITVGRHMRRRVHDLSSSSRQRVTISPSKELLAPLRRSLHLHSSSSPSRLSHSTLSLGKSTISHSPRPSRSQRYQPDSQSALFLTRRECLHSPPRDRLLSADKSSNTHDTLARRRCLPPLSQSQKIEPQKNLDCKSLGKGKMKDLEMLVCSCSQISAVNEQAKSDEHFNIKNDQNGDQPTLKASKSESITMTKMEDFRTWSSLIRHGRNESSNSQLEWMTECSSLTSSQGISPLNQTFSNCESLEDINTSFKDTSGSKSNETPKGVIREIEDSSENLSTVDHHNELSSIQNLQDNPENNHNDLKELSNEIIIQQDNSLLPPSYRSVIKSNPNSNCSHQSITHQLLTTVS
ncbi:hypothetical protein O181_037540 [Austropuccinia psidii MF-1]|uniref:SUN domain-containing protein n=1 Tax=Austropuccinia psidii MF-1 TaxID=1389203 RepID=A0A9Q3DB49_9BASI|nr:hypothetical protein [Austropuccinia psidii MF-1]